MKNGKKVILVLILSISLLMGMIPGPVNAQTETVTLENVLVKADNEVVIAVGLSEFKGALRYRDNMFDYLAGSKGYVTVYGVSSADKYIYLDEYKSALRYNGNDIALAIEASAPITDAEVNTFHRLVINDDGTFSTEPIFGQEPSIVAQFIQRGLPNFGFVITEVNGIDDAAKFSVEYYIAVSGQPALRETTIVRIGEEAGTIQYKKDVEPYNRVNIKIYNEAEELLFTFRDVVLITGNSTTSVTEQFIELTITN